MTYNETTAAIRETLAGILTAARDAARDAAEPTPAYTVTDAEEIEINGATVLVGPSLDGCDDNIAEWDDDAIANVIDNEMDRWGNNLAGRLA